MKWFWDLWYQHLYKIPQIMKYLSCSLALGSEDHYLDLKFTPFWWRFGMVSPDYFGVCFGPFRLEAT